MAKKKQKAKKQTAGKQKAKKQPPKKQPPKKQPPKKHKGKGVLTNSTPGICTDFTASNNSQVCFQNIPVGGCTLTQVSGDTFPFSPYSTNANGLRYITLQPGGCTTIVVAAINEEYSYTVSCCPLVNEATHTVNVT